MKKKIIIALIVIIVAIASLVAYLNAIYLPVKIKSLVISTIEKQLGRKASLGGLKYNLFKGIVINNLTIYDGDGLEEKPFLAIKEISFNLLYLPIFKSKTVIIPAIKVDSAEISIVRLKENRFNFSSLLDKLNTPSAQFSIFVYKLNILNARVNFIDQNFDPAFSYTIPNLNGRASLSLPKNIKFNLEAKLSQTTTASLLLARGNFNLTHEMWEADVAAHNINLLQFRPYYNFPEIKSVSVPLANFKIGEDKNNLSIDSNIQLKDIDIEKEPYSIKGEGILRHRLSLNPRQPEKFSSEGSLEITKTRLEGVSLLQEIREIKGILDFNQEGIKTENLQGIAKNTLIMVKGGVADFANPRIAAKLYASPTLEALSEIFTEQLKDFEFEAEGKTQLILGIEGQLNDLSQLKISGLADISGGILALPQLPGPLTDINGKIEFDKDSLRWKKLYTEYAGTVYLSDGFINNFASPHLELTMGSKLLSLSAKVDIQEKNLKLSQLEGKYLNTLFDFTGEAGLSNPRNPLLDLTGTIKLNLRDLGQMLPDYKARLNNLKPEGSVYIDATLQGKLNNWKAWQAVLSANSPQIIVQGLKLGNLILRYGQEEESMKFDLSAVSYSGTVNASGSGSLSTDDFLCSIGAKILDLDLEQLKNDTPWKNQPTSGKLSLVAEIQGPLKRTKKLRGSGSLVIKDGKIGELNLLKGLGALLFIPEFEKIVFQDMTAEFEVSNGLIYASNFQVNSNEMVLVGNGNLDFSGNLDFTINAQLNQQLIDNSPSFKKTITSFLSSATNAIVVKVSGTLQNPQYSIVPMAGEIIKKLKEFFTEDILR